MSGYGGGKKDSGGKPKAEKSVQRRGSVGTERKIAEAYDRGEKGGVTGLLGFMRPPGKEAAQAAALAAARDSMTKDVSPEKRGKSMFPSLPRADVMADSKLDRLAKERAAAVVAARSKPKMAKGGVVKKSAVKKGKKK